MSNNGKLSGVYAFAEPALQGHDARPAARAMMRPRKPVVKDKPSR